MGYGYLRVYIHICTHILQEGYCSKGLGISSPIISFFVTALYTGAGFSA